MFKKLKIKYKIYDQKKPINYQILLLKKGLLDGIVTYTPGYHKEDSLFTISEPIIAKKISVFMNVDNKFVFNSMHAIQAKSGLISTNIDLGSIQGHFAKYYLDVKRNSSNLYMLQALLEEKVDFVIWDEVVGDKIIKQKNLENKITKSMTPLHKEFIHMAFGESSGCKNRMNVINKAVRDFAPEIYDAVKKNNSKKK